MLTSIDRDTMQSILAQTCSGASTKGYICSDCHLPVALVSPSSMRPPGEGEAFFQHCTPNPTCLYTIRHAVHTGPGCAKKVPPKSPNPLWVQAWQQLCRDHGQMKQDADIVLCDTTLLTHDVVQTPSALQLGATIAIYDATMVPVYEYYGFLYQNTRLFFCTDEYGDSANPHHAPSTTLVHCSDNVLRQVCYAKSVQVRCEGRELQVRFLQNMGTGWPDNDDVAAQLAARLQLVFGTPCPQPSLATPTKAIVRVHRPLQVLSTQGRLFIDGVHRAAIEVFPTDKIRMYNCPPGSGKTTALKAAVKAWPGKKILILVFNKSNQTALHYELRTRPGCVVLTLDALCAAAMPKRRKRLDEEELPPPATDSSDSETDQTHVDSPTDETHVDSPTNLPEESALADVAADEDMEEGEEQQEENDEEHGNPCGDDDDDDEADLFDPVFSDSSFITAFFPAWNLKEKLKHGGGSGSASMVQNRLLHPRSVPHICKFHQRLSLVDMSDTAAPWAGSVGASPIKQIIDSACTFASRKFLCDRDLLLVSEFQKYDVIMVDEVQDCCIMLEQRLLKQAACPVILVGDYRQTINDFKYQINDSFCSKGDKCRFPAEAPMLEQLPTVEFYTTFRLCPLTTAFLEDHTALKTVSVRPNSGTVHWQTKIIAPDTLILCRMNENVIKIAIQYEAMDIRVLGGARIAAQLKTASSSGSVRGMGALAQQLARNGTLSSVAKMLADKEIDFAELQHGGVLAVSTVHILKGFECANTAVHSDVFQNAKAEEQSRSQDQSERNIMLVALSRHTNSMVLLVDIPEPVPEATGATKKQKTIDFPKI